MDEAEESERFTAVFYVLLFFCFDHSDEPFKYRGRAAVSASAWITFEKRIFPSFSAWLDLAWCHACGISSDFAEIPESCTNQ